MIEEFKKFIMKGNMLDMAIGIVIGAAFGTVIKSLVADVLMPPIGLALGNVDFSNIFWVLKEGAEGASYATVEAAKEAGAVTMNIGLFFNQIISFLIIGVAVFMLVKAVNKMREKEEEVEEAPAEPEPSAEEVLLAEIRDLLKK